MSILLSYCLVAILCGAVGWLASHRVQRGWARPTAGDGLGDPEMVRDLLASLHCLSVRVAADVGEHNNRIGEVDRQLTAEPKPTALSVHAMVNRLLKANQDVQSKLSQAEGKLEELSHQMESYASEARTDVLTGLSNRRVLEEEMVRLLAEFRQTQQSFSLIMADIDRFKKFNDAHGHLIGDEVLRGVALILKENTRRQDIVTRYGGEEFAILMPGTSAEDAQRGANAIRLAVEKACFPINGKSLSVTISMGVAEILPFETNTSLMKRADQALYAAKDAGRNISFRHDGSSVSPVDIASPRKVWRPQVTPVEPLPQLEQLEQVVPMAQADATSDVRRSAAETDVPNPLPPDADPVADLSEPESRREAVAAKGTRRETIRLERAIERHLEETVSATKGEPEPLQNLANKTMFCQDIRRQIAQWDRGGATFSVILLSIDQHEGLARRYGSSNTQLFWRAVAEAIRRGIREMDLVARYSDQTFGLVLPECGLKNAIRLGERLRKEIHGTPVAINGQLVPFSVSLGIVEVADGDEMATLVQRVRGRLQQAAATGGNRSVFAALAST